MKINSRIMVLRESAEAVVGMLAGRSIRVTQQGMQAFVEWHPTTHKPIRVNVPHLPDDSSDELIDAVQGFIDHEVGHLLHTDPKWTAEGVKRGEDVSGLRNMIEDPRIESRQSITFKGSAFNLANTSRFVCKEIIEPGYRSAKNSGDDEAAAGWLMVPMVRAICGQGEWVEFMKDKWPAVQEIVNRMGPDLCRRIRECKSNEESLELAEELKKAIQRKEPPPPPPEPPKPPEPKKGEPGEPQPGEGGGEGEPAPAAPGGEEPNAEPAKPGDKPGKEEEGEAQDGNMNAQMNVSIDGKRLLELLRKLDDYDGCLEKAVSARAMSEAKGSDYIIYTKDEDRIAEIEVLPGALAEVAKMEEEVDAMVGPLARELERVIIAKAAAFWTSGHKSGRLHGASLARLKFGRDDVFRRKHDTNTKKVAFELMVDCSGSMHSRAVGKIKTASFAAYALASMLDRLQIPCEVIGYTTKPHSYKLMQEMQADPLYSQYARREALHIPIFKAFGERVTSEVKARFVTAVQNTGMADHNVDGESLMIGLRRVLARQETRKIIIVLSDGRPATRGDGNLDDHLKAVVKTVGQNGVELFGIGICDNSVKNFYPRHSVIQNITELPAAVMGELRRFIMQ